MKKQLITREHDNATIESIRATVDRMVEDIGFDDMTIRDICYEVGITVGTFYHYFSSKHDLLLDRYLRTGEYFEAYYNDKLSNMNEIDALKDIIEEYVNYSSSRVYKIYKRYFQVMIDEFDRWVAVRQNSIADIIEKIVSSGQENGVITKVYSAYDICSVLLCFINGLSIQYFTRDKDIMKNKNIIEMINGYIETLKIVRDIK